MTAGLRIITGSDSFVLYLDFLLGYSTREFLVFATYSHCGVWCLLWVDPFLAI